MKKILTILITTICIAGAFSFNIKNDNTLLLDGGIAVNKNDIADDAELIGVDELGREVIILFCPGTGVTCAFSGVDTDGEVIWHIGKKGRGRDNIEIHY